jgi:hypothetical protein
VASLRVSPGKPLAISQNMTALALVRSANSPEIRPGEVDR